MKKSGRRHLLGVLGTGLLAGPALAQAGSLNLNIPQTDYMAVSSQPALQLAAGDMKPMAGGGDSELSFTKDNEGFEESWFTGSKAHQYFGLGALALVALTAVVPKPDTEEGTDKYDKGSTHEILAKSATALAAAAATTGLIYHWEDFDFSDGFTDPDNLHMMLGALGTLAMVAAISEAPESGHAGMGILGGVAMGIAVKIEW